MGGKGEPVGLLGSDVLSRFGGIRIDFAAGALVLPGPEGAPSGRSPPRSPARRVRRRPPLTAGESGTTVPLTVTPAPGDVSLSVAVRFAVARAAGLRRRHRFLAERGVVRCGPRPVVGEHRPGPASGHGVLGDHRAARPQRAVVRARAAAPSPAHRVHRTSAPSARRARSACWARTSSGVTAGSSSTMPAARWSWADGGAWCGSSGPGRRGWRSCSAARRDARRRRHRVRDRFRPRHRGESQSPARRPGGLRGRPLSLGSWPAPSGVPGISSTRRRVRTAPSSD